MTNLGLCVPAKCQTGEVESLTNHLLRTYLSERLQVQQIECHVGPEVVWYNSTCTTIGIILAIVLVGLSTAATILDSFKHDIQQPRKVECFIKVFSIIRGYKKLVASRSSGSDKLDDLRCLDGLRVISILWLVIVHSYNFGLQWLMFDNIEQVHDVYKSAWIQWIANGTFSVDNFFLISGMLAWLSLTRAAQVSSRTRRKGSNMKVRLDFKRNWSLMDLAANSLRRYLRLAPTVMLMIFFSISFLPAIGWGPKWSSSTTMFDKWCRKNWFINLLMLQNFIESPNMCFSHSWFVAVDFQLFVLLQLVIIFTNRLPIHSDTISEWALAIGILTCQVAIAAVVYIYRLPSIPLVPTDGPESMTRYYSMIYIKPHYWCASYFLGVLLAMFVSHHIKSASRFKMRSSLLRLESVALCLSLGIFLILILSSLPYFRGTILLSGLQSALFALLARPIWSLGTCCMLFPLVLQSDDRSTMSSITRIADKLMSSAAWLPLSRLTFSAYLLHPVIMAVFYGSRTETFQFSHTLLFYFTTGNIFLTYIAALISYLVIESPIQSTIKRLFPPTGENQNNQIEIRESPECIGLPSRAK